jgi:tRNA (guanine-N7-)-methyltransferase
MQALFVPPDYFAELAPGDIFPDASRPLEVDLGSGDGTFLLGMAQAHPDRDFLGVERMAGRVSKTLRKIARSGLGNVKILRLESAYSVAWLLPTARVSRLHLLCPDPWPKKKHEARRLVAQEEFLAGLERILVPGGEFLLKTDDRTYFEDALRSLGGRAPFTRLEWPDDFGPYVPTDFEKQWVGIGRTIHRARWQRL